MSEDESMEHRRENPTSGQTWLGVLALLGLIAAAIWAISTLAPDDVPRRADPGYVDNVFASPVVIAAARVVLLSAAIVLLFAGVYVVASMTARISRGQWLRRAGPFESELSEELEHDLDRSDSTFERCAQRVYENQKLERLLAERDRAIEKLSREREGLLRELEGEPGD